MPRQPRQFEIDRIYHIVNRGVEKRKIFIKDQDYSRFIIGLEFFNCENPINLWSLLASWSQNDADALAGTVPANASMSIPSIAERLLKQREENKKSNKNLVELLAFTLMPNHYHFIIREIKKGGISDFMRKMGGYSTYFNKQYDRVGSLFQSRYKIVPIRTNVQLYRVFNYVHTNPVELKEPKWKNFQVKNARRAIKLLEDYKWSSYRDYIGKLTHITATQRDFFLDLFGGEEGCKAAVEEWISFKALKEDFGSEIIE